MSQRLPILVIGASGVLGRAVVGELAPRHDIVSAGSKSGDVRLDIADPASIVAGLRQAGALDAIACAAGAVNFAPFPAIKPAPVEQSAYGLRIANKLMGHINLALAARDHLRDGGSITLVSGITAEAPIAAGTPASIVNGALHSFVMAAAVEMPRGIRINVVCPTLFEESRESFGPFFRGFDAVPVARAARAFSRSAEGLETGKTYRVY